MVTLHVEHAITDYDTWRAAFENGAPMRAQTGVRTYEIQRPVDDPNYILVNLEFDDVAGAEALLALLRGRIWATPEGSPALVGQPQARIVATVESR